MHRYYSVVMVLILVLSAIASCTSTPAENTSSAGGDLPEVLTLVSYGLGSGAFVVTAGFREAVEKNTSMKVRQEPYGDDLGRLLPLRAREGHLSIVGAGATVPGYMGRLDFAKEAWGPQPIRIVHPGGHIYMGFFVRADSGIKTISDLKGKRVAYLTGAMQAYSAKAFLAFAGMKDSDVTFVPFGGYSPFARSVLEGGADTSVDDTTATIVKELASSRYGAHFLPIPASNKEGWAKMRELAPWYGPALATVGDGIPKEGTELGGYNYCLVVGYNWLSDNVAYTFLKAIEQGYPQYKDTHFYSSFFNPDPKAVAKMFNLDSMLPVPFHPGAITYWREKGLWTKEHDAWQAKLLAEEPKLRAEFEADRKAWLEKNTLK